MSLPAIIHKLCSSSILADTIASRLASRVSLSGDVPAAYNLQQEVVMLKQTIKQLNATILMLREVVEEPEDDDSTDEQQQEFVLAFKAIVDQMQLSELVFAYTKENLAQYPKRLRYLAATVLVNSCTLRGKQPQDIWQELISTQGAI
jgi:hypothetical protein